MDPGSLWVKDTHYGYKCSSRADYKVTWGQMKSRDIIWGYNENWG